MTYTSGFWRAKRPCAARTHLLRLINTLNGALPAPFSYHSFAALFTLYIFASQRDYDTKSRENPRKIPVGEPRTNTLQ